MRKQVAVVDRHSSGNIAVVVGHLKVKNILACGGQFIDYWVKCRKRNMIQV
jgi:hypothetical protein